MNGPGEPPVYPIECAACPFTRVIFDELGKLKDVRVPKQSIGPEQFKPQARILNKHGQLMLDKSAPEARIPLVANLPTDADTLVTNKDSYRTNRATFATTDWSSNTVKIYVPETHHIYGTYEDDEPPLVQIMERSGTAGAYSYVPVLLEATAEKAFKAAQLVGGAFVDTVVSNWQAVTDGQFYVNINGVPQAVTGLDFSGDSTMAMIAATIEAGLSGATVTWDTDHFVIESTLTSGGTNVSPLQVLQGPSGTDISGNPWICGRKGESTQVAGKRVGWMVSLVKEASISTFNGLVQIG